MIRSELKGLLERLSDWQEQATENACSPTSTESDRLFNAGIREAVRVIIADIDKILHSKPQGIDQ